MVPLRSRLKDLLGPVTRVEEKKRFGYCRLVRDEGGGVPFRLCRQVMAAQPDKSWQVMHNQPEEEEVVGQPG